MTGYVVFKIINFVLAIFDIVGFLLAILYWICMYDQKLGIQVCREESGRETCFPPFWLCMHVELEIGHNSGI